MHQSYWIWYPGDFSIYHGMLQNFSREERGYRWPAYWRIDDCRRQVRFRRGYYLKVDDTFTVYSNALGYVCLNGEKFPFGKEIRARPGINEIEIIAGAPSGVPSIYVAGNEVYSDGTWEADDFIGESVRVGWDVRFNRPDQNPSIWEYEKRMVVPTVYPRNEGSLFDFGEEVTAEVLLSFKNGFFPVTLCYGETEREAMDTEYCYYSQHLDEPDEEIPRRAFRYLFIPEAEPGEITVKARHFYVDLPVRADFHSSDSLLQQIWEAAGRTFRLCSGIFMIDGIKRDRWIWSGDAYQSLFVNRYYFLDAGLTERTLWALRGNDPPQHINTIVDYSLFWILSVWEHFLTTGDQRFVQSIYPKMKSMMEFLSAQTDEEGMLTGRKGDWIFIDWAELDKEGVFAAEQILYAKALHCMADCAELLAYSESTDYRAQAQKAGCLIERFWDSEKGAYIDSIVSGKRHVSRQTNILAVLFHTTDQERTDSILKNVLENDVVPKVTTPYFQFYELEALCRLGKKKEVLHRMKEYWGGMLETGLRMGIPSETAVFWEEYDPQKPDIEQQEMYGDPYGKSLCHAWSASPICLLARHFIGLRPDAPGYAQFTIEPEVDAMEPYAASLPLPGGRLYICLEKRDQRKLTVQSDLPGGSLLIHGERMPLPAGEKIEIAL